MSHNELNSISYKLVVSLSPNWDVIIKSLADQCKQKPEDFILEIFKDEQLNLNNNIQKEASLFGKSFRFVLFYHADSKVYQIWSDHAKTFVDEVKIQGMVFGTDGISWIVHKKYSDKLISKPLILTPDYAAFDTYLAPDELILNKLATIPYYHILRLLLDIAKQEPSASAQVIKKFPKELEKELNENNVKYEPEVALSKVPVEKDEYFNKSDLVLNRSEWFLNKGVELYEQEAEWHKFSTPYYSVLFDLEIFE